MNIEKLKQYSDGKCRLHSKYNEIEVYVRKYYYHNGFCGVNGGVISGLLESRLRQALTEYDTMLRIKLGN